MLETGCVYVAPLLESLALPDDLSAATNPKSSTGRLDVFTRVIADGVSAFDQIPAGYAGQLFAEICPQTFPGRRAQGLATVADPLPRGREHGGASPFDDIPLSSISSATSTASSAIAPSATPASSTSTLVGGCPVLDYWEPIHVREKKRLILDPDQFYILASKEAVHVPPTQAAEMVPFNPLVGEFRVHYAGFFDPGFGHAAAGGEGAQGRARGALATRCRSSWRTGRSSGGSIYERLTETPKLVYGRDLSSHYQAQGLKLSKHFK